MIIGFKRLSKNAVIPTKANPSDSGWDLYAAEDATVAPGETVVIKTNIATKLPEGFGATVRPRSGVTSKTKLRVQLGTIDHSYIGDVGIIIDNTSQYFSRTDYKYSFISDELEPNNHDNICYYIKKGDKLAQLVLERMYETESVEIFELEETERGSNGFGSSGDRVNY